jgi:SAM-dependent methyltransferase
VLLGDPGLAAVLADALSARDPVERYTHGFHTWPAGLHPDAARALIEAFPGDSVLDPFCGGGTVLLEALAHGRRAIGRDLSTVAIRVARARTSTADEALLTSVRTAARRMTEAARTATERPPERILRALEAWYAPYVLCELECIRRGIALVDGPERTLLEAAFSSILVKVSWRRSDTSPERERHDRPRGTAAVLFHKKVRELGRRIATLRDAVPAGTPPVDLALADARELRIDARVDLVLTSPPYPSTYDYLPLQHLRRVWFNDPTDRDEAEIGPRRLWRAGSREATRRWRADTQAWMSAAAEAVRPGGHIVIVIGDGFAPGKGIIDVSEATEEAAQRAGLASVARASLERPDFAQQDGRWEHGLAFQKPA